LAISAVTPPAADRHRRRIDQRHGRLPACGAASDRVHSRYVRTAADLPWQGRRVVLRVTARRFRCPTPDCPRRVFCERLPRAFAAHARATGRLIG
jgi:transposase